MKAIMKAKRKAIRKADRKAERKAKRKNEKVSCLGPAAWVELLGSSWGPAAWVYWVQLLGFTGSSLGSLGPAWVHWFGDVLPWWVEGSYVVECSFLTSVRRLICPRSR